MNFKDKLKTITEKNNSLLCVGLDSDVLQIPQHLIGKGERLQLEFNKQIIDATYDLVCAYKLNTAFYEHHGVTGIQNLYETVHYIRIQYPAIPIILDAKRGDIGNTNSGYAGFAFDWLGVDAITLHPYLGKKSLRPFLERKEKGLFILCKTSNEGGSEFQDLPVNGKPFYQILAQHVSRGWNENGNCGLVVGATYPEELDIVRHIVGKMPLLIPGIGAQGGDVEKTVKAGVDTDGFNAIINSSRGILFASSGSDFAKIARSEAQKLQTVVNKYRRKTV